jgi:hypothetical protein
MISTFEKGILRDLYLRRISFDQFCELSSLNGNDDLIMLAVEQGDDELLEYLLIFYYHFGFHKKLCSTLQNLLIADWHKEHFEVARILQFKLSCPDSIGFMVKAIEKRFDYLFEQDDFYPFVSQCLHAIRIVGGDEAKNVFEEIIVNETDQEIKQLAAYQLAKM